MSEIWDSISESAESFHKDYTDCVAFLENLKATSCDEEIGIATSIATLNRFDEAVVYASEMIAKTTLMLSLIDPLAEENQKLVEYITEHNYSDDETSRNIMQTILIMVSMHVSGEFD